MRSTPPSIVFIVPGPVETHTGGYAYERRMVHALRDRGCMVDVRELDGNFPHPKSGTLREAARVLETIADGTTVIIDGLAFGAMPDQVEHVASRLRVVGLIHLPLSAEF